MRPYTAKWRQHEKHKTRISTGKLRNAGFIEQNLLKTGVLLSGIVADAPPNVNPEII